MTPSTIAAFEGVKGDLNYLPQNEVDLTARAAHFSSLHVQAEKDAAKKALKSLDKNLIDL